MWIFISGSLYPVPLSEDLMDRAASAVFGDLQVSSTKTENGKNFNLDPKEFPMKWDIGLDKARGEIQSTARLFSRYTSDITLNRSC